MHVTEVNIKISNIQFQRDLFIRFQSENRTIEIPFAKEIEIKRAPFDSRLNPANKDVVGKSVEFLHFDLLNEVMIGH